MRVAEILVRPTLVVFTRRLQLGQENIPATGPAILVLNHLSYADPLIAAQFILDRPRDLRFLVKSSMFRLPFVGRILRATGQIPVHRYTDRAGLALASGLAELQAGHVVAVYPEGTCTKDPDLWPMQGKTGAARLAAQSGAPVIPIVQWGPQRIHHPVTGRIRPWPRTPVTASAGPPVELSAFVGASTPEALHEMTDVIMRRLRDDLAALRGEPAPTGPLFVPPRRGPEASEPTQEVAP
jgi:1-acyl-sn-glycerol-3-phosphate acyltransferase